MTSGTSHGYTGQRYDSETGLYYYKMRYYSPKLGRFLQADPIGYAGGLNLYAYAENVPTVMTDPIGLEPGTHTDPGGYHPDGYGRTSKRYDTEAIEQINPETGMRYWTDIGSVTYYHHKDWNGKETVTKKTNWQKVQNLPLLVFNLAQGTLSFYMNDYLTPLIVVPRVMSGNGKIKGVNVTNNPAFEGVPEQGPIPRGSYKLGPYTTIPGHDEHDRPTGEDIDWFNIYYREQGVLTYGEAKSNYNRGHFGLHAGTRTNGCIACGTSDPLYKYGTNPPKTDEFQELFDKLRSLPMRKDGQTHVIADLIVK